MTLLLLWGLFWSPAFASDDSSTPDILVQAPRLLDESIEASRSVSIIDEKEIRLKNPSTVADLLRDLPGVEVVRQGPIGQTTSVFIRGARSEDTLVLIDGVVANDAMSPAGGYDFSTLSPQNIDRIEVYRGPQSVRFGGGALGGVINIITKEGRGPARTRYFIEGGSYDTLRTALGFLGRSGTLGYSIAADGLQTRGFPAAAAQDGNTIPDGAKMSSASGKLTWQPDDISKINAVFRYTQANVSLDPHGGPAGDDPNDTSKSTQFLTSLEGQRRFLSERLKSTLGIYYSEVNRSDANLPDANNPENTADSFLSENQKIESNHELTLTDNHLLRVHLQWNRETGGSSSWFDGAETIIPRQEQSIFGEALTYLYESPIWFGDAGFRLNEQSRIGNIPSERASIGRFFDSTKTRMSLTYGSGFKIPSLYQLFSNYGNQTLQWESSSTTELTVEQKFGDGMTGSLACFQNSYHNMIDFDPVTSKYLNVSAAISRGVEAQVNLQMSSDLNLDMNYTYLDSVDETTGWTLLRRPSHSGNLTVRYKRNSLEAFSQVHYVGERPDVDPITFARLTDVSFVVFNVGGAYLISQNMKLSARIENLFNQQYQEVAGYGTPGFSYYLGLSGEL